MNGREESVIQPFCWGQCCAFVRQPVWLLGEVGMRVELRVHRWHSVNSNSSIRLKKSTLFSLYWCLKLWWLTNCLFITHTIILDTKSSQQTLAEARLVPVCNIERWVRVVDVVLTSHEDLTIFGILFLTFYQTIHLNCVVVLPHSPPVYDDH